MKYRVVHDEKEHSDWFSERSARELISPNYFYETLKKRKLFSIQKHFLRLGHKCFVRNKFAFAGKQRNIMGNIEIYRNNVSSFATTFINRLARFCGFAAHSWRKGNKKTLWYPGYYLRDSI